MTHTTLADWLRQAPFGLTLSSGFFGFFAHTGVLAALEEAELTPACASGSSAGALVTGLWAAGMTSAAIEDELLRLQREHFWDPGLGLGVLRGRLFQAKLAALLPVERFEMCRVPLAVSVFDVRTRRTEVVQSGALEPAIRASCTLPVLFQPAWVGGRPLLDGGILDRPGLAGMSHPRVLYHHLSSRSPWRRAKALALPERPGLTSLVLDGLPRVTPFHLERGREALVRARDAARRALEAPIVDGVARQRS